MPGDATAGGSSHSARAGGPARERSLWAITSLACSLFICPPMCVIGPVLGLGALVDLRYRPHRTGRGLAWAGIAIGLAFTLGWSGIGLWWNANVRRPLLDGPAEALALGCGGDVAGFTAWFTGLDAADGNTEAAMFLEEVTHRYGGFRGIRTREVQEDVRTVDAVDPARVVVPYFFDFERESVAGAAEFVTMEERRLPMILRWRWIRLDDPVRGELAYPAAARAADKDEAAPDRPQRP